MWTRGLGHGRARAAIVRAASVGALIPAFAQRYTRGPDGSKLSYLAVASATVKDVYVLARTDAATLPVQLTSGEPAYPASWATDNQTVVFGSKAGGADYELIVQKYDGTTRQKLLTWDWAQGCVDSAMSWQRR